MKKYLLLTLCFTLLILVACNNNTTVTGDVTDRADTTDSDSGSADTASSQADVTYTITGENFAFFMNGEENPTLRVNKGDLVRIEFNSTSGFHDWVVDELQAATTKVRPEDGLTVVEFVADEAGEFSYYCSVGQHRANGMVGTIIVE